MAEAPNNTTTTYTIREAVSSDHDSLLYLLAEYYLRGEPVIINHAQVGDQFRLGLYDLKQVTPFLDKIVDENPSLVAVDENGQCVGMVILATDGKDKLKLMNSLEYGIGIFDTLYFTEDLREQYFCKKTPGLRNPVRLCFLTVAKPHRGKRLASWLVQEAVQWAKNRDADMVYGLFTSRWARKAANSSGFSSIYNSDLNFVKNMDDGERLFYEVDDGVLSIMILDLRETDS